MFTAATTHDEMVKNVVLETGRRSPKVISMPCNLVVKNKYRWAWGTFAQLDVVLANKDDVNTFWKESLVQS